MLLQQKNIIPFCTFFSILIIWAHSNLLAQETGFLKFELNIDSVVVVIDRDILTQQTVAAGDSIELVTGTHVLEVYPPFDVKTTTYRLVYKDSTRVISYTFKTNDLSKDALNGNLASQKYFGTNFMLVVDHDSEVYLGRELLGTEFITFDSPFQNLELTVTNPDFGSKNVKFPLSPGLSIYQHYRRPSEAVTKMLTVFPGLSQIYKRQYLKGIGLTALNVGLLSATIKKTQEYRDEEQVFFSLRDQYNNAVDEEQAFVLGNLTENQQDVVTKLDNQRRILLGSTLIVYAFNIFDAFRSDPKGGYRKPKKLEFYLSQEYGVAGVINNANLKVNLSTK